MEQEPGGVHLAEGEKHLDAGEWREAETAFRRAAEVNPSSALALSKLGVALAHQRRLDEAEKVFVRAVEVSPRYAPAWSNLGNVYRETGRPDEALEAYQRAVAVDPEYWVAHQNLGGLYKQLGRTSEAISSLRKATRLSARGALRTATGSGRRRLGCLGGAAILLLTLGALIAA
jgi:protein O-GlcNAc transferase